MIIVWQVLFTLMLGRTCPDLDCEVIFERQEWQAAYLVVKQVKCIYHEDHKEKSSLRVLRDLRGEKKI